MAVLPTPVGGPKGSGLSLMFECLTSLMLGPSYIRRWLEETQGYGVAGIIDSPVAGGDGNKEFLLFAIKQ